MSTTLISLKGLKDSLTIYLECFLFTYQRERQSLYTIFCFLPSKNKILISSRNSEMTFKFHAEKHTRHITKKKLSSCGLGTLHQN